MMWLPRAEATLIEASVYRLTIEDVEAKVRQGFAGSDHTSPAIGDPSEIGVGRVSRGK